MNEIYLDEKGIREKFFPFTHTRSVADLRVGILTLREKWEIFYQFKTEPAENAPSGITIPSNWIPNPGLLQFIAKSKKVPDENSIESKDIIRLQYPWDICKYNGGEIRNDFNQITEGRVSEPMPGSCTVISPQNVFIEKGAKLEYVHLNASQGPIYIGRNAEIMEGSLLRGPIAICESAVVKMGTIIYGATTLGPHTVVGGEIKNCVILDYSNKAHHGYLGDSVIGAWCNLGAGTSNSNLKNNAGTIKVWVEAEQALVEAGQKCGLLMGDYSRSAINTSFNSGTVVGICCNVASPGLTPKYIPNFSWSEHEMYSLDKLIRDLRLWKKLKNQSLTEEEIQALTHIFEQTKSNRT
jgi:UDP-N-acetylglucosamine diphosphorylase/glucosamine-1-phosphate N-acetyltransferase